MPITSANLKPAAAYTYLLNRHYVTPALKEVIVGASNKMHTEHKVTTYYLDANFPFMKGFPLIPHLSHNDGKKIDLAFYYFAPNNTQQHGSPSIIGYGVGVSPDINEINQANICKQKGYWQYNLLHKVMNNLRKKNYGFDPHTTKELVNFLVKEDKIGKLFIEPHLVQRLHLKNQKIRFQGCHSVRHDDHIHIQLK